jgi:Zn-dependent peptidase ImmA (M78 family)/DNA-binding XRE family transcriptional regulator
VRPETPVPVAVGARARRLRQVAGLDQAAVAHRAAISAGSLSKLENGIYVPTEAEVERLARVLACDPNFLMGGSDLVPPTRPWLRAYADASQRALDRQIADCVLAAEVIDRLSLRTLPEAMPTFRGDPDADDDIEQFAIDVRAQADLSAAEAITNTIRTAERLGFIVLPMRAELGRHLGLSLRVNLLPFVCVSRPSEDPDRHVPGDRQRFTVAHELGHHGLHGASNSPATAGEAARIERQAHRFAGALLCPADALQSDLRDLGGRVTLTTLMKLKGHWGMSVKALVVRCSDLGLIGPEHARSLYKQISARGWNKGEPGEVPNETAVWFDKAIRAKFRTNDSSEAAAAAVGLRKEHLSRWLDWGPTPIERMGQLVDLAQRRSAGAR